MRNQAFDEFCSNTEMPTMSQFATRLACMCERERAFFNGGYNAGVMAGRKDIDLEISLLRIVLEEAESQSSCGICAVVNKIRAAISQ